MKKGIIILALMLIGFTPIRAQVEQQQQFTYYFYEAIRLILAEDMEKAWELIQFCYALQPEDATVNHYMGCFLQAQKQDSVANYFFQRAYELEPATYWYRYAAQRLQTGDATLRLQTIGDLEKLAKTERKNAELLLLLQKAYMIERDFDQALLLQDRIDSINGYNAMSAMQRYRLHATMHRNQEAMADVERYLEIDPDDYQFRVFQVQLYEQTKQKPAKLIAAYREVLRLNPRNLMALNNLAWNMCLLKQDLPQAEQYSRITILSEPSNATFLDTYAWIQYLLKDYETALFYIERALEHAPAESRPEIDKHYKAISRKVKK